MSGSIVLSTNERKFVLAAANQGLRVDGRQPHEMRRVQIKFAEERGVADVQIGKTRVLASASALIVPPYPDRPSDCKANFEVTIHPTASPELDKRMRIVKENYLAQVLERVIRRSNCIDLEALCIVSGEKVWDLRVTANVLNDYGNVLDCVNLAAVAALKHFRRPVVTVKENYEVIVHGLDERVPIPLTFHHTPLSTSLAFLGDTSNAANSKYVTVVDPSLKEEAMAHGTVSFTMAAHQEICALHKRGGAALRTRQLMECTELAQNRVMELQEILEDALEAEEKAVEERREDYLRRLASLDVFPEVMDSGPQPRPEEGVLSESDTLEAKHNDVVDDGDTSMTPRMKPANGDCASSSSQSALLPAAANPEGPAERSTDSRSSRKSSSKADMIDVGDLSDDENELDDLLALDNAGSHSTTPKTRRSESKSSHRGKTKKHRAA